MWPVKTVPALVVGPRSRCVYMDEVGVIEPGGTRDVFAEALGAGQMIRFSLDLVTLPSASHRTRCCADRGVWHGGVSSAPSHSTVFRASEITRLSWSSPFKAEDTAGSYSLMYTF